LLVFLRFRRLGGTYISDGSELVYLKSSTGLKGVSFEYYYGYSILGLESKVEGPLRRRFKAKEGKTRIQEASREYMHPTVR
jgi:hypothetical protein